MYNKPTTRFLVSLNTFYCGRLVYCLGITNPNQTEQQQKNTKPNWHHIYLQTVDTYVLIKILNVIYIYCLQIDCRLLSNRIESNEKI